MINLLRKKTQWHYSRKLQPPNFYDIPQKPESDEVDTLLRIVADKFRTVEANEAFLAATYEMKIEDVKSQLFLIKT